MILLDLFCGRWGWSRAFAKRGWKCIGVDLTRPPDLPDGCEYAVFNVMSLRSANGMIHAPVFDDDVFCGNWKCKPDAIVASPPCEEFSVHGMKHFHPHPKYPANGIRLFEHTRQLCEAAGVPYVIENVRVAQQFVGNAVHHCGPFYLWGNAVPPLVHRGIEKKMSQARDRDESGKRIYASAADRMWSTKRKQFVAQIPPELANCVADYFERILEKQAVSA